MYLQTMRHCWLKLGLLLFLNLSLWGCQGEPIKTVRIGVLVPLSGDLVETHGRPTLEGIELAAHIVNDNGGIEINGQKYQLELLVVDNQDNAQKAVAEAERLINQEKVSALIGLPLSRNAIPVARIAEEARIPLITSKSTNPETTDGKSFVYRIAFTDTFQGEVLARFARETLRAERAAVLYDVASAYNQGLAVSFRDAFNSSGGEVVAFEKYTSDTNQDFHEQLGRISTFAVDVLFLPNYPNDVPLQATQARDLGIEATILGGDAGNGTTFQSEGALEGAFYSKLWDPAIKSEAGIAFIKAYETMYGHIPEERAAAAYDALGVLVWGMKEGQGVNAEEIQAGLQSTVAYTGVTGRILYRGSGDPIRTVFILQISPDGVEITAAVEP